jgi:ABC-type uncharacterized transport system substrate-binding protein
MAKGLIRPTAIAACALLCTVVTANAHPHVWVTTQSEVVFAANGAVTAVRHAWTFDEMFSAFATQGLDKDNDGKLTREELAELAKVNVTSLKEFDFFSFGRSGERRFEFGDPDDYWLEAGTDNVLTLHFTLPLKTPVSKASFSLEIYDPTYFVAFAFDEKDPVKLVNAPPGCAGEARGPDATKVSAGTLSESFFNSLSAGSDYGSQFANRITLRCR